ncbi:hypothetical protein J3R83DRAFT_7445 [Lanmaoa asiatica]|nr:hypothetical protein J3R83DRAFT_7445 [Lanmaoa asiatica]
MYINANHPVFNLIPPSLSTLIENCYTELGRPNVNRSLVWTVYLALLRTLQDHDHAAVQGVLSTIDPNELAVENEELPLVSGLKDLPVNENEYMGGVGNGTGLCECISLIIPAIHSLSSVPEHHCMLDDLENEDDPLPAGFDESVVDIPALVVNGFSDDSDDMSGSDANDFVE